MNENELFDRIDILISLLIPKYDESKYGLKGLPLGIIKLSDGNNTVADMSKKLGKSRHLIENALSKLRSNNIIKSVNKGSKTVYIRLK